MNFDADFNMDVDFDEALTFQPGQKVELKSKPGTFDTVAVYDPMMVPSIWLENDPRPRYPHELRVVSQPWLAVSRLVGATLSCPIAPGVK